MANFQVKFSYNDSWYTAEVFKVPVIDNSTVEYHVSKILPQISGLPKVIKYVHEGDEDGFTHTITFDFHITDNILKSIAQYCRKNKIPFTS